MKKNTLIGLALLAGLLIVGGSAYAHGPGFGPGGWGMMGGRGLMGSGPGYMWGNNRGYHGEYTQENAGLQNELYQKQAELNTLLAAPEVDQSKATALQAEINELSNKLSESRLAAQLENRRNNRAQAYDDDDDYSYCWR